jgi:hypothetical protein
MTAQHLFTASFNAGLAAGVPSAATTRRGSRAIPGYQDFWPNPDHTGTAGQRLTKLRTCALSPPCEGVKLITDRDWCRDRRSAS